VGDFKEHLDPSCNGQEKGKRRAKGDLKSGKKGHYWNKKIELREERRDLGLLVHNSKEERKKGRYMRPLNEVKEEEELQEKFLEFKEGLVHNLKKRRGREEGGIVNHQGTIDSRSGTSADRVDELIGRKGGKKFYCPLAGMKEKLHSKKGGGKSLKKEKLKV